MEYFLTKAKTLEALEDKLEIFSVPKLTSFTVQEFQDNADEIIEGIKDFFEGCQLVLRSSAVDEDGAETAKAGEYASVLNVSSSNNAEIQSAITTILESYVAKGCSSVEDEVLVQEMISDVSMSGVVFTHDLNTGAPYLVINYDDVSGLTDTVTSGGGEYSNRTIYIHRSDSGAIRSARFRSLLDAIEELELIMGSEFLDIEFAIDSNNEVYLFQVRAITTKPNWNRAVALKVDNELNGAASFIRSRFKPVPGVFGKTTVFGQMPDWNPAEMIGRAPRALACSLYQRLITNDAWRIAREKMGYRVPIGHPLMVTICGQPFIDTRLSFNSFLPPMLPDEIGEIIVNACLERLTAHPELHDKIEFSIAVTTYSFNVDEKIERLVHDKMTTEQKSLFKNLLREHTLSLITGDGVGSIEGAMSQINTLSNEHSLGAIKVQESSINDLYKMLDDCVSMGTIPFSILARHGFIARTILISLEEASVLDADDVAGIQGDIKTIAAEIVEDMESWQTGTMTTHDFMARYGHLRPGTYDVMSPRYDQMKNLLAEGKKPQHKSEEKIFTLSKEKVSRIDSLLESEGLGDIDALKLLAYIKQATIGREYAKFVFTRSISEMLEVIASYGQQLGLNRDEMSHIPLGRILDTVCHSLPEQEEIYLRNISLFEAERNIVSNAIRLPQVLFDESGVFVVPFQVSQPNYITDKKIMAKAISVSTGDVLANISGKIVLIENADPGFDWIFGHSIVGLITMYGGANSHMAIRCAEFGLPAAIGCGEQRFESLIKANSILLDCASGLSKVVN